MGTALKIPWLDLKRQYAELREELHAAAKRVLDSGTYILGPEVAAFESEFAAAHEAQRCIGISSGTQALQVALKALNIGPGDEVAVPAFTFVATATEVEAIGARPLFIDVDPHTLTLDPADLKKRLTPKTKAVIPVHLYGGLADMDAILKLGEEHDLSVVEDCAQAHLARYKGRTVGTLGNFGAFSFYPSKNLGALGDAGALLVRDAKDESVARAIANCGREAGKQYSYDRIGHNFRLDALQAALLRVKLQRLPAWTARRREIAKAYRQGLSDTSLTLPPEDTAGSEHAYHQFVVRTPDRDRVLKTLHGEGIGAVIYYPAPLHLEKAFSHLGLQAGSLPESERAAREVLALPMFPELTDEEVGQVVQTVRGALSE